MSEIEDRAKLRRSEFVSIRMTATMWGAVKEIAKKRRMSAGEWVRRSVEGSLQYAFYEDPTHRVPPRTGRVRRAPITSSIGTFNSAHLIGDFNLSFHNDH